MTEREKAYTDNVIRARAVAHELARGDRGFNDRHQFRDLVAYTATELIKILNEDLRADP